MPHEHDEPSNRWRRAPFRFGFIYLGLFFLPPFGLLWDVLVPWVGRHVLGIESELASAPTGSGDRMFDWVQLLCTFVLALAGTLVWCAVTASARHEARLRAGLRVGLRYSLAFAMLGYGFHKLFPLQFPVPGTWRLLERYGDSSPMGLLWTFMGQAPAYVSFTGLAEVTGGLLLLSRRTTTLGALVVAGVMSNVVMLNFCYDVPVKIFSTHLLLVAVLLLLPDLRRLVDVLVLGRGTHAIVLRPPFATPRRRRLWLVAKSLALVVVVGSTFAQGLLGWLEDGDPAQQEPPTHAVVRFTRNGVEHPPLVTDAVRWQRVLVTQYGRFLVTQMDGTMTRYRYERADDGVTLTIAALEGDGGGTLVETIVDDDRRTLVGTFDGAAIEMELARIEPGELLLRSRGFHWVSEVPFNR